MISVPRGSRACPRALARLAPVGDGGGPVPDAELGIDPSDVILHGLLGQEQARGDLPVGLPVRDERHDLCLSRGQLAGLPAPASPVSAGAFARRPDARPGAVQREAPARSGILAIVHVTSGCGRLRRYRSEHNQTRSVRRHPMKVHANLYIDRYGHLGFELIPRLAGGHAGRARYVVPDTFAPLMRLFGSAWSGHTAARAAGADRRGTTRSASLRS